MHSSSDSAFVRSARIKSSFPRHPRTRSRTQAVYVNSQICAATLSDMHPDAFYSKSDHHGTVGKAKAGKLIYPNERWSRRCKKVRIQMIWGGESRKKLIVKAGGEYRKASICWFWFHKFQFSILPAQLYMYQAASLAGVAWQLGRTFFVFHQICFSLTMLQEIGLGNFWRIFSAPQVSFWELSDHSELSSNKRGGGRFGWHSQAPKQHLQLKGQSTVGCFFWKMPMIAIFAQAVSDDDTMLCSNSFEWNLMWWDWRTSLRWFLVPMVAQVFSKVISPLAIYKVQRKGIVRMLGRKQTRAFSNYLGLFMGAGGRTHYFTISAH